MSYKAVGKSDIFLEYLERLDNLSSISRPILIIGERGSGKEAAAKRIHDLSENSEKKPYVTVNCGALPESLIDSELFGHKKGSFTGSIETREGRFSEANNGTLFLDEIGLIPLSVQEKILRVVEYGTYYTLGDNREKKTNARIICATNADLLKLCDENKFKRDLLDRLSFEVVYVPPLRNRGEDIILLAETFVDNMNIELNRYNSMVITDNVKQELLSYSWPGNIRELKNVMERATLRAKNNVISEIIIDPFINPYKESKVKEKLYKPTKIVDLGDFNQAKIDLELSYLKEALKQANNKQTKAAKLLNLTYDQFRGLYRKYSKDLIK